MSPAPAGEEGEREADGGERNDDDDDDDDDLVDWDDEQAAETELVRIEMAMAVDRPRDAPRLTGFGPDGEPLDPDGRIADAQWQAFEQGVPRWWLVVPPVPEPGAGDGEAGGAWCYADEALIAAALKGAEEDEEYEEDDEEDEDGEDGEEREDDGNGWEDEDGAGPAESADETGSDETGSDETGSDETGADETGSDGNGATGDSAGGDGTEAAEPAGASSPEAPPAAEPAPSPPPQETARRWTYPIPPPNDGRCQPYYGRGW